MAFTVPVFEMDGDSGHAALYLVDPANLGDRAPFTDPVANASRLLFHTANEYFEIALDETVTLSLPARARNSSTDNPYVHGRDGLLWHEPFSAFPAGSTNIHYVTIGGITVDQYADVQIASVYNYASPTYKDVRRTITPIIEGNKVRLMESYDDDWASLGPGSTSTYPATSIVVRCVVLRLPVADETHPIEIDPANNKVSFAYGKFKPSHKKHPRAVSSTSGAGRLLRGRTIDHTATGLRYWKPDGGVQTLGTYSSGYGGPTLYNVRAD